MQRQRDPDLAKLAKSSRQDMSPPERLLWSILRAHRLSGWKFSRQVTVGHYIIDFAARREKLAIELDGHSHDGEVMAAKDAARTAAIEDLGWRLIRFTNSELATNPDGVAETILAVLHEISPSPRPSPQRGEGAESPLSPPGVERDTWLDPRLGRGARQEPAYEGKDAP